MKISHKIAIILSGLIGVMSVFAGSMELLNRSIPSYTVLNWLVIYNVILGVLSIVTAFLIWKKHIFSKKLIITILTLHSIVLAYLYFFNEIIAIESIKAMSFRVSIWILIYLLTYKK